MTEHIAKELRRLLENQPQECAELLEQACRLASGIADNHALCFCTANFVCVRHRALDWLEKYHGLRRANESCHGEQGQ